MIGQVFRKSTALLLALSFVAVSSAGDAGGESTASTDAVASATEAQTTEASATTEAAPQTTESVEGSDTQVPDSVEADADAGLPPQPLAERGSMTISIVGSFELYSALLLAQELGEFDRENLDVEIVNLPSADAALQLAAGNIDACLCSVGPGLFNNAATGWEPRAVGSAFAKLQEGLGVYVRTDLAEEQPENLAGGTMAISGGFATAIVTDLDRWLAPAGLTINDITPLNVAPADALLALQNGEVEMAYLIAPFYAQAVEENLGVFVPESAPEYNNLGAAIFFGGGLLNENSEVGQAFVRAYARTVRLYLQGPYKSNDDTAASLAKALGITVEQLRATDVMLFDPDLTMDAWPAQMAEAQELWNTLPHDILSYDEPLTADALLLPEFTEEVLAGG